MGENMACIGVEPSKNIDIDLEKATLNYQLPKCTRDCRIEGER
jgi:hypothetical protein